MDARPADAARRALRAARQQQAPAEGAEGTQGPAPRTPAPPRPAHDGDRPADAARAALREAVAARRAAHPAGEETGPETPATPAAPQGDTPTQAAPDACEQPTHPQGPQDPGSQDPGSQDSGSGHSGSQDRGSQDSGSRDCGSADRGPRDSGAPASPEEPARSGDHARCGDPVSAGGTARSGAPASSGTAAAAGGRAVPGQSAAPRPADAAREALRAALARRAAPEERPRTGTATPQSTERGTPRPASTGSRGAPAGAREVRKLLAGAFAMPACAEAEHPPSERPASGDVPPPEAHPEHGAPPRRSPATPTTPTTSAAPMTSAPSGTSAALTTPAAPATPRLPRTMASPHRDGEHRRTFPAFPSRGPDGSGFAETWWGNAWVTALEKGALDAARLARGRGYAQQGRVDAITVTPGSVLAYVQGSRPRPYRVQVRLRTLDDADWDRFLESAAERPAHIAALLDRQMPHSLADCGVPLLPGPGDLDPHCSCPDRGHPCKHAAALCYQTARLLDADPFVLLLLRGRGERELLDALSRRNATRAARAARERRPDPLPGVRASDVLARRGAPPPLPAPLPAPAHPEQPPVYPAAPGGPDPFALDQLATDAAARAHALLTTGRDPVGGLTLWQDVVRLAAARPGSGLTAATRSLYAALASATGRGTADLARAVAAWRQGGAEGLAVLEEPWDPPAGRFDRARPLLLAADLPAFRPWRNRLTHPLGHLQLRLGRDGLWYAYESEPGREDWWPRGTPDTDPVGALTGLGTPGDL
ncbi:SWIM zinc finger family protein [Streptomyces mexicanus]